MAVINLGSINIDHVYQVPHFVKPGETLSSTDYQQLLGGKGANQSVALAKAGVEVKHVGRIGAADQRFKQQMQDYGVDCTLVKTGSTASGHAIIQVEPSGENSIVLFGGANQQLDYADVSEALSTAADDDWVLTQNETSGIEALFSQAHQQGLKVAFNPAPMGAEVKQMPLEYVDLLIVNEVEAAELTSEQDTDGMLAYFRQHHPQMDVIITLGKAGVKMLHQGQLIEAGAFEVEAVDTTAAGDTFIGFFLAAYTSGSSASDALRRACAASALAVTREGAAQSIPEPGEVDAFLAKQS